MVVSASDVPKRTLCTIAKITSCSDVGEYLEKRYVEKKHRAFILSKYIRLVASLARDGGLEIPAVVLGEMQQGRFSYFKNHENAKKLRQAIAVALRNS